MDPHTYNRGEASFEAMLDSDLPEARPDERSQMFRRRSAGINLQKSIHMLDEAVGATSSTARGPRTPRNTLLKYSTYTPTHVSTTEKYDVSHVFTPTPRKGGQMGHDFFNSSLSMIRPAQSKMGTDMFDLTEEVTSTNVALLLEDDPGMAASAGLYRDFEQCMKHNSGQNSVLDLLLDYENVCSDQVIILRKLAIRATKQQDRFQRTFDTFELLDKEKMTWQLVRSLYRDRLDWGVTGSEDEEDMMVDKPPPVSSPSEQNIMKTLFEKDSTVRQSQLVVDWLENCAEDSLSMLADNVKFFSDQAVAWENTLHQLQNKARGVPTTSDRDLVDQLDPDAPIRQSKILDDLDKEDETRLLQHLFACIRAGQLDKAQEVCQTCGQSWRAATLEGWRLFHDPNYESLGHDGQIGSVQGNSYRDVWKLVCWNMAQESKFNLYEKAIYAVLSGNLKAVLPVCRTWYDYLWAYYKVMVDVKVEQELRLNSMADRLQEDMPNEYWEKLIEPSQVFQDIEASFDKLVRSESQKWFHVIQKYIILGDVDALIEVMYNWVRRDRQKLPPHLVRFMAHLVLFLRAIGHSTKEELCTTILETYVEDLINNKHKHQVAHYVATLPKESQVIWYAKFLEGIDNKEERQHCLQLAEEEGLNIPLITKTVVENIRHRDSDVKVKADMPVETAVSEEDRKKIEAIDWLVFDQSQRSEAVKQANAVMRSFIAVKKHVAAREVFDKLPADSVDVIYRIWLSKTGSTSLLSSEENAIREYMCIKAYLDAIESFNDWFSLCHHGKPAKPDLTVGASFTDRVAYEHRMKQYQLEVDRWKHTLLMQTKTTKDRIYNVLLFTDGGWMVDQREEKNVDESRHHQMALLRQLHLPALCLNLHYVLHTSELFAECLQLADYVSAERYQLYKEFNKDDLQRLLRHIRDSSLALLDQNKDPLGYQLV
ncbi:nuclear pore complex protein Nup107-like [Haliotis cracherodii]|uniref:nuclear pore complex protein Nup107-like n=1 Tax=Haliotis cracherodii TaxID=6455 RepID=UPI0039E917CA